MKNTTPETTPRWAARLDALRPTTDFSDLLRIVAAHYELYERGHRFLAPFINRQIGSTMPFIAPDKDVVKSVIGKGRSVIHPVMYHAFVNELINFAELHKGRRQLISPHQTTHHSAQFSSGTFSLRKLGDSKSTKYELTLFGAEQPVIIDGLQLTPEQVNFIIVRPKIGKLGTASALKWEVLFYRSFHSYLINHVDSDLNPRYAGII